MKSVSDGRFLTSFWQEKINRPEAEPYSITPVIALVLDEHDSRRFCIFSSSSCNSFCLILILASITRCSSCKKIQCDRYEQSKHYIKAYREDSQLEVLDSRLTTCSMPFSSFVFTPRYSTAQLGVLQNGHLINVKEQNIKEKQIHQTNKKLSQTLR